MINKDLGKYLAQKNGNEILVWSWNNPTPPHIHHPETDPQRSLCTRSPSFYSGIVLPVHMDMHPLQMSFTSYPCARCIVALELIPRSLATPASLRHMPLLPPLLTYVCPPFPPPTLLTSLSTSVDSPSLVLPILLHFLEPIPSPASLNLRPIP